MIALAMTSKLASKTGHNATLTEPLVSFSKSASFNSVEKSWCRYGRFMNATKHMFKMDNQNDEVQMKCPVKVYEPSAHDRICINW